MTREQACDTLQNAAWLRTNEDRERIEGAVEFLCGEPCEDTISRQAALDTIESWLSCDDYNEAERHIMRATQSVLYDLPSVTPKQRTGHWIIISPTDMYCSECNEIEHLDTSRKFCAYCGTRMSENPTDSESEDKE